MPVREKKQTKTEVKRNRSSRGADGGGSSAMTTTEQATMKMVHRVLRGRWLRQRGSFRSTQTYLALAIVPPWPLVTQTNKTARTYHRGAVSDLGLDAAIFLELDQVIERIPWPRTEEGDEDEYEN